jgi:peptide chain release factor subunit 1
VNEVQTLARRLFGAPLAHPVVSLYLDLEPTEFALPAARATQITSLLDQARRDLAARHELGHEERTAVRESLEQLDSYLRSRQAPLQGARALAVFCSRRDGLLDAVPLSSPVAPQVAIDRRPRLEPLLAAASAERWCAALVSRRELRVFTGSGERMGEQLQRQNDVHGRHQAGGHSQANYQRSYEQEADEHLRQAARALDRLRRREPFDVLVLGGPDEVRARLRELLGAELAGLALERPLEVDLSSATAASVRAAMAPIVRERRRAHEQQLLARLMSGLGTGGATTGAEATLRALHERRVEALVLAPGYDREGSRCPTCGLLSIGEERACPADGGELEQVASVREASVEAALDQDAEVVAIAEMSERAEVQRLDGIAALLRF